MEEFSITVSGKLATVKGSRRKVINFENNGELEDPSI